MPTTQLSLGTPITLVANQTYALPASAVQLVWQNTVGADVQGSLDGVTFSSLGVSAANEVKTVFSGATFIKTPAANTIVSAKTAPVASFPSSSSGSINANSLVLGSDVVLTRDSANTLALRNGVSGQGFHIYNTFTDSSNYERLEMDWVGNNMFIKTTGAGTGSTARNMQLIAGGTLTVGSSGGQSWVFTGSVLTPTSDNVSDLGIPASAKIRNIFVAGSVANRTKAGTPTDADVNTPTDGMMIIDTTASKIWVRIGGTWKQTVALT